MSGFLENLSLFLAECRNDALQEVCNNPEYTDLKSKNMSLYDLLRISVLPAQQVLLAAYLDCLSSIASMEVSYCYLCGLCDANKAETQPTMAELAGYARYAALKSEYARKRNKLNSQLDYKCCQLIDDYVDNKNLLLDIEKAACYSSGLRDKKRLDKQFDPASEQEWNELIHTFL